MKDATEQDWLNAVKSTFEFFSRQNPPAISRSAIESLLIGLEGQETIPVSGKPLSAAGKETVRMLRGYLDVMKKKKKKFLPIK